VIPPADFKILERIDQDPVRSTSIDGAPRAIRYYSDVAVVIMSPSNVREICFENGVRRVMIAGSELLCQLNGPPQPMLFKNATHW